MAAGARLAAGATSAARHRPRGVRTRSFRHAFRHGTFRRIEPQGRDMPIFTGTTGADTLFGGAAADTLQGLEGNDLLMGSAGNDRLEGGTGIDTLVGGAGSDVYLIDSLADRVVELAGGGTDTILSALPISLAQAWAIEVEALTYTGATGAILTGNDRDNRLTGGAGADTLRGGIGADTLDGGLGADRLEGGVGDDLYLLGAGDVAVEAAGQGRDGVVGLLTSLSVPVFALSMENLFHTGAVGRALTGNALDNVVAGGSGGDTLSGGEGRDSLAGGLGSDRVGGDGGDDVLAGGRLAGWAWGPVIGDNQADTLAGGAGNDTYLVTDLLDSIEEAAGEGTRDVVVATIDTALSRHAGVEALVLAEGSAARIGGGSDGADLIIGNAADNVLSGGPGADTLAAWGLAGPAGGSPDLLDGGADADVLLAVSFAPPEETPGVNLAGGAGDDVYVLGAAGMLLAGSDASGTDVAVVLVSADLSGMEGIERIVLAGATVGLAAADRAALAAAQGAVEAVYSLLADAEGFGGPFGTALDATGTGTANAILGNALSNRLAGGGGNDTLLGAAGADTLDGGTGLDRLIGGAGNDVYFAETGDVVVELAGGGTDIVHSTTRTSLAGIAHVEGLQFVGAASVTLVAGLGAGTSGAVEFLGGGSGNDTIQGDGFRNSLSGGEGQDRLLGQGNHDTLLGGGGADDLQGGLGDDQLWGGLGDDSLDGGGNWDTLRGGAGRDLLTGGDGRDSLVGDGGADTLYGDNQNDWLVGGAGNDWLFSGSADAGLPGVAGGDILWGDAPGAVFGGADAFVFGDVTTANAASELGVGSGDFRFFTAAVAADYQPGLDRLLLPFAWVGNGNGLIEGAATADASGNFDATAEVVFFPTALANPLLDETGAALLAPRADDVLAVIGDASGPLPLSASRLFVLNDGANAAFFVSFSTDGNAVVTTDELFLWAVVANLAAPGIGDVALL
jgi:Ca2+-binding RTX toxin-like protein